MSQDHFNALPVGFPLNEYEIKAVLGHGGFGITYLAYDKNLDKDVAIKEYLPAEFAVRQGETTVRPRSSADEEDYNWGLKRFMNEAQTLAVFQHPSIVPVYRFFEANGTAYMVMEYQKGESLAALMRAHKGEFTEQDLLDLVLPLLDGLEEVHKAGYLHRDVKPGNIYIRENGSPVLLDFGAARHAIGSKSKSLTSIVTPGYAPLEQYFADGNQGPWTDIYALAAILYQAVAGDPPPEAPARVKKDPIVPAVEAGKGRFSEHFLMAIDAALSVEEEERPQSVQVWRETLLSASRGAPAETQRPEPETFAPGETLFNRDGKAPGAASRRQPSGGRVRPASGQPASAAASGRTGGGGNLGKIVGIGAAVLVLLGVAAGGTVLVLQEADDGTTRIAENGNQQNGNQQSSNQQNNQNGNQQSNNQQNGGNEQGRIGDEDAQRRREEEEARRRAEEEAERRRAEEEVQRRREEEEARRRAEEEERRRAEEEAQRQAEEEERRRAEEEARRQAEEEERRRQEAEAERRRREEAATQERAGCQFSVSELSRYYDARSCVLYRITLYSALRDAQTGSTSNWRNSRNGARGTVTIRRTFTNSAGQPCREFMQTITVDGVTRRGFGTACARGNGWQISG